MRRSVCPPCYPERRATSGSRSSAKPMRTSTRCHRRRPTEGDATLVGFYATAAQVIPLLFLALVFERRFFESPERAVSPSLDNLVMAVFVLGETLALIALKTGEDDPSTLCFVV